MHTLWSTGSLIFTSTSPITGDTEMIRGAGSVRWSLYRDAECSETACVLSGSLSVDMMQPSGLQTIQNLPDNPSNSSSISLALTGIQLIPELQRRIWDACDKQGNISTNVYDDVFPLAVEDLSIGSRAAELELDDKALLYCKLQLIAEDHAEPVSSTQNNDDDWFSWKVRRATEYRARGNEAFKQESYNSAVRLYKRALEWLEPPTTKSDVTLHTRIQYSIEELQKVNCVAVACYANMATCYSKLNGDGDVDRCIAAASSALALDDKHVKARYRRSQAYVSLKDFDLALADLNALSEIEPDNKLFRSALARAHTAKTQHRKKQQSAFANLFDK